MNYSSIIKHINDVMTKCGDNVNIIPTGGTIVSPIIGDLSIEIVPTVIKVKNHYFEIKPPRPIKASNPPGKYIVSLIRIPIETIETYTKGEFYSDEKLIDILKNKHDLFAYY